MGTVGTVRFKLFISFLLFFCIAFGCYVYRCYYLYNSIYVKIGEDITMEYGSHVDNIEDLFDNVSGNIISVVKNVNTSKVGQQEVVLRVQKENITRDLPVVVDIVDTVAPEVQLKEDVVNVKLGTFYDPISNVLSVIDGVDGDLVYKNSIDLKYNENNYYTIIGSVNTNIVGNYQIEIKAVDNAGNISFKHFKVKVNSNGKESLLSSTAYSLLGSPYAFGGNNPSGFDCSGFVQYVYACSGFNVSRGASDQLYDGYEVSYANMTLGDIIVWGYDKEHITHTAIYVGDGLMIHASNPVSGVVVDKIDGWGNLTNVSVVSVRRLP